MTDPQRDPLADPAGSDATPPDAIGSDGALDGGPGEPAAGATAASSMPTYPGAYGGETPAQQPPLDQQARAQPGFSQQGAGQQGYAQPGYPQPGYGQPAYGQPGYPQPGYGYGAPGGLVDYRVSQPWGPLTGWWRRVGASIIDSLLPALALVVIGPGVALTVAGAPETQSVYDSTTGTYVDQTIGAADSSKLGLGITLLVLGGLLALGISVWNRAFRQGRTGQSIGKKMLGMRLVREADGRPMGAGMSFVRELAHSLDSCLGYFPLGYLWPLWDDRNQTWADKLTSTVVVDGGPVNPDGTPSA